MMDDILNQIKAGEVSGVQFKERILDKCLANTPNAGCQ